MHVAIDCIVTSLVGLLVHVCQEEEEEDLAKTAKVHCEGALPLAFGAVSQRGLAPVKLAYNLRRPDDQLR